MIPALFRSIIAITSIFSCAAKWTTPQPAAVCAVPVATRCRKASISKSRNTSASSAKESSRIGLRACPAPEARFARWTGPEAYPTGHGIDKLNRFAAKPRCATKRRFRSRQYSRVFLMPGSGTGYLPSGPTRRGEGPSSVSLSTPGANS